MIAFFIGIELGPRHCRSTELQADLFSMWVAPEDTM